MEPYAVIAGPLKRGVSVETLLAERLISAAQFLSINTEWNNYCQRRSSTDTPDFLPVTAFLSIPRIHSDWDFALA
jgi:hypothetical protein